MLQPYVSVQHGKAALQRAAVLLPWGSCGHSWNCSSSQQPHGWQISSSSFLCVRILPHQLVAGVGADDVFGGQLHCHLVGQFRRQAALAVDFGQLPQLLALRLGACGAVRTGGLRSKAAVVAIR